MKNQTILLVEDDEDDVELTLRAFEEVGVSNEIVVARDGIQALDYLFETSNYADRGPNSLPIVILLDLKLPKLSGLEFLRRIRMDERTKLLPVVVLTSSKEEQDIIKSYSLGANGYVRKPVNYADFLVAVKQLGFYWLLLNEPPPQRQGEQP